jgi:hypothetical protein
VIAREDGYTYIAALRSPDLRHTTKREGDTSVTSVTNKNGNFADVPVSDIEAFQEYKRVRVVQNGQNHANVSTGTREDVGAQVLKGAAAKRKPKGKWLKPGGSALVRRAGRNAAQGRERGGSERERERHVCAARLLQLPDGRHSTENTEGGEEEKGKRSGWRRHGRVSCFLSRPER